ncbi:MAG: 6-phosphofructokinase [Candidatus Omnitrophota bacterium]
MKKGIKKIGVLCSGGDGPGMNAAIRSVVRSSLAYGISVGGIMRGYEGLIDDEIIAMDHRSVSNIINRGGTILKTARSKRFKTPEGMKKAFDVFKKHRMDGLIVIGGDGSYRGADEFYKRYKVPVVGMPGTIDNDLCGTDQTIGCSTAVNTALEAIDKIRDTAHSMERIFIVEVMGNSSGYIAMQVALGSGAESVIIPERKFDYEKLFTDVQEGYRKGKISWIVITAEGAGKAPDVAKKIMQTTGLETRFVVLGHVQRGGVPTASDRILATRLGVAAVELLLKGIYGKSVGVLQEKISVVPLAQACHRKKSYIDEYDRLMKLLR